MKFILLGLLLSFSAMASETLVAEFAAPYTRTYAEPRFDINREMGRAWVSVIASNSRTPNHERQSQEFRQKVDGLSFDNATNAVVYNGVVCATVRERGRGPFRYNQVTPTGCKLFTKEVTKTYDDGYHTRKYQAVQVYLNVL